MSTPDSLSLRQKMSRRAGLALTRRKKDWVDTLFAFTFFLRHALRLLPRRLVMGRLGLYRREWLNLFDERVTAHETHYFGKHLDAVLMERDDLFLQLDLKALHGVGMPENRAIASKSAFAAACAENHLPHVPTRLIGPSRSDSGGLALPAFVKPDRAYRARGCALLQAHDDGSFTLRTAQGSRDGRLGELLSRHCKGEALVVQPLLTNHEQLEELVGRVPLTVRVVTGVSGYAVEVLSALAEIPLDDTLPLARRWAMLPIELETGRLAQAHEDSSHPPDPHPVTGRTISGFELPYWEEVCELACDAHHAIAPEIAMIGWDFAITDRGPLLIEGNGNWAVATHMRNSAGFDLDPARRFAKFAAERTAA